MFAASKTASLSGYQIQRSLRFNSADSAYLSRTPASAGNRQVYTISVWVKRSGLGAFQHVISNLNSSAGNGFTLIFADTDKLQIYDYTSVFAWQLETTQVFRDVSAWYHIVFAVDTTQATASNRVKLYVNGSQVTAFSTATYPTQNYSSYWNNSQLAAIGRAGDYASSGYFNGYMTEIYNIDGQALTPSSFGITNPDTGVWQPKAYAGTYGTNGFYLNFSDNSNTTATTLGKDYSRGTNLLTYSEQFDNAAWTKVRSSITANTIVAPDGTLTGDKLVEDTSASNTHLMLQSVSSTASNTHTFSFYAKAAERSEIAVQLDNTITAGAGGLFNLLTGATTVTTGTTTLTTTAVGNGWWRCSISGVPAASGSTVRVVIYLSVAGNAAYTGDGYSGIYIWGAQLEPGSSAGAYTQTTAGTAPNNWTPNNFSVSAGAGNDSLVDSPTAYGTDTGAGGTVRGNYCTWNPLKNPQVAVLTNGNLDLSTAGATTRYGTYTTIGVSTGQWYWEITAGALSTDGYNIGIVNASKPDTTAINGDANSYIYLDTGNKGYNGSLTSYGATYTAGDVIGVALDLDAGTLTFYKNGSSQGTAFTGIASNTWFPTVSDNSTGSTTGSSFIANFGQRPFAYTAPSGFKALCTQNLPTPTIGATASTQAGKYFNAVTYTAPVNSGTLTVTGVGFQPDFTWWKTRSTTDSNVLMNVLSGSDKYLLSNSTNAEATYSGIWTATSDGFTASAFSYSSNQTYVAWNWKANGAGVTNTSGSITSTVSANTTSGFSVVTYTGTGAAATVGHGLGSAPRMIIVKSRNFARNWNVYHGSLGATQGINLNATAAATTDSGWWSNTAPTSTVFTAGSYSSEGTVTYVAYCFAEVPGFSKFGSYTGNGSSTDGPFVFCGFRPAYVVVKRTDGTSTDYVWWAQDNKRGPYNATAGLLELNSVGAENSSALMDFVSNGFKIRNASGSVNANGSNYIFMAFAEAPQKFALAR